MRREVYATAAMVSVISVASAFAQQRPTVVRPLRGYECMTLNLSDKQSMDFSLHVPVYAQPSQDSRVAGYAAMQVAVRLPLHVVNGFYEALFPTGATVWIETSWLRPYRSVADPSARCIPALLSNGRPGFDYPHS